MSESGRPSDPWTATELIHPVSLAGQFKKPHVKFVVDVAMAPITSGAAGNAFDRLMDVSRRLSQLDLEHHMPQLPAKRVLPALA